MYRWTQPAHLTQCPHEQLAVINIDALRQSASVDKLEGCVPMAGQQASDRPSVTQLARKGFGHRSPLGQGTHHHFVRPLNVHFQIPRHTPSLEEFAYRNSFDLHPVVFLPFLSASRIKRTLGGVDVVYVERYYRAASWRHCNIENCQVAGCDFRIETPSAFVGQRRVSLDSNDAITAAQIVGRVITNMKANVEHEFFLDLRGILTIAKSCVFRRLFHLASIPRLNLRYWSS